MTKVYLLKGEIANYSDCKEWLVKVFASKSDAQEFCDKANTRAKEIEKEARKKKYNGQNVDLFNEFDPENDENQRYDPTYIVEETELV